MTNYQASMSDTMKIWSFKITEVYLKILQILAKAGTTSFHAMAKKHGSKFWYRAGGCKSLLHFVGEVVTAIPRESRVVSKDRVTIYADWILSFLNGLKMGTQGTQHMSTHLNMLVKLDHFQFLE